MRHRDRSLSLIIFGILTALMGCLVGVTALAHFLELRMLTTATHTPQGFSEALPGLYLNFILAVGLVWLGKGSIQAKRWARSLLLIFSWSWLAVGLLTMVLLLCFLPRLLQDLSSAEPVGHPALSAAKIDTFTNAAVLANGIMSIVMPVIWIYFYSSRNVKATCRAQDPARNWTDGCPLPVLALTLWTFISVSLIFIRLFTGHFLTVAPFFGALLTGASAKLVLLLVIALWATGGWLLYRLDSKGWWLLLLVLTLGTLSNLLTFAHYDFLEMCRQMNVPEKEIASFQKANLFPGNSLLWLTVVTALPFFGYLFFIKKYFQPPVQGQ